MLVLASASMELRDPVIEDRRDSGGRENRVPVVPGMCRLPTLDGATLLVSAIRTLEPTGGVVEPRVDSKPWEAV